MKITPNNIGNNPININQRQNTNPTSKQVTKSGNYDRMTIESNGSNVKTEAQFVSLLKSRISSEVREGTGNAELNHLKNQVDLNEYKINPSDIAKKMLLQF